MIPIVEFPKITLLAAQKFKKTFLNKASLDNFCRYITGIFSSENKTVTGINNCFKNKKDQSCLNKWINSSKWDHNKLNEDRLDFIQEDKKMKYSKNGVIAIDNLLVDHDGKFIENVGWFWDHADKRYKIAHDITFSNYVLKNGKHFPIDFNFFLKRDQIEEYKGEKEFKTHSDIFIELSNKILSRGILGIFTFDSYFSNKKVFNHLNTNEKYYVGDLKFNRIFYIKKTKYKLSTFCVDPSDREKVIINNKVYWFFKRKVRLKGVDHPITLVVFWKRKNSKRPYKALASNNLRWDINRISNVYSCRWTGTETFHRDIKQHLGMGSCQLRGLQGLTRHIHIVCLAYSLLMRFLPDFRSRETQEENLNTIGEACRGIQEENLRNTITWTSQKIISSDDQSPQNISNLISLLTNNYGGSFLDNVNSSYDSYFEDTG